MCGICGLVWRGSLGPNSKDKGQRAVHSMITAMEHRGPDGTGIYATDRYVLGHQRLAIIDIDGAPQPMWSPEREVALSFNGEIYNFQQLMEAQRAQGWRFRTRSDTETLIAGYLQQGPSFDEALNGMYSYAILDTRTGQGPSGQGRLQLGIDPVAIKPLFIWEGAEAIIFASELRGILAALRVIGVSAALDRQGGAQYLAQGWVAPPRTLLQNTRKLVPGGRVEIDLATGAARDLPIRSLPEPKSLELEDTLTSAVERQMIADAPLGFFLSGGIDSSLLVAIAQRLGVTPRTFTVRFEGEGYGVEKANEADVARQVAQHCGADHHELSVTAETIVSTMDDTFVAMDQPICDVACLPLLLLSRFASERVKVCLSGDGGDELFQGYPRHGQAAMKAYWRKVPPLMRSAARGIMRGLPTAPSQGLSEKLYKLRVGFSIIDSPDYVSGPFSGRHTELLTEQAQLHTWAQNVAATKEALFEADMQGQLAGQMLPKTDHVGMFASLECRVPFLDLEMVALARAMPGRELRSGGQGKAPLRALLAKYLPPEIAGRKKHGFRVPLTDWLRNDLAETVRIKLLDPVEPVMGLIQRDDIERLLQAHTAGKAEHSIRIWALLALQTWLDRHGLAESAAA